MRFPGIAGPKKHQVSDRAVHCFFASGKPFGFLKGASGGKPAGLDELELNSTHDSVAFFSQVLYMSHSVSGLSIYGFT